MKISEFRRILDKFTENHGDLEIMILDGFNGGGNPREINMGPTIQVVTDTDAEDTADCEDIIGNSVAVIGYGFY